MYAWLMGWMWGCVDWKWKWWNVFQTCVLMSGEFFMYADGSSGNMQWCKTHSREGIFFQSSTISPFSFINMLLSDTHDYLWVQSAHNIQLFDLPLRILITFLFTDTLFPAAERWICVHTYGMEEMTLLKLLKWGWVLF